jgi:3-hydroxy-9,10-secoandrosta-1,3,5(10)-triene-9,17-dione monooxygenase
MAQPDASGAFRAPEPDFEELVKRARELKPTLKNQQDESDVLGTYSQALHETFRKAGFYRAVQPRMFGGYEFDLPTSTVRCSKFHTVIRPSAAA